MSATPVEPPVTGHAAIDAVTAALEVGLPLAEHHDRLAAVHEVLAGVLHGEAAQRPQPPLPGDAGAVVD